MAPNGSDMNVLAIVPARGGSKGLPGKNLRLLGGKPLLVHTLEVARRCPSIDRVVLSTDDPAIADCAREHGFDVPWLRPAELATDEASGLDVLRDALARTEASVGARYGIVVYLQPTSPLRTVGDVEGSIRLLVERDAPAVLGVCELEHPLAWTVEVGPDGGLAPHAAAGGTDFRRGRQAHRPAHRINGAIYVYRADGIRDGGGGLVPGSLAWVMPVERSVDIDTLADLWIAEALLERLGRP